MVQVRMWYLYPRDARGVVESLTHGYFVDSLAEVPSEGDWITRDRSGAPVREGKIVLRHLYKTGDYKSKEVLVVNLVVAVQKTPYLPRK